MKFFNFSIENEGEPMALQRKPVKKQQDPDYPDSESYAASRRKFLQMLSATAVGIGLSSCGSGPRANARGTPQNVPNTIPTIPQSDPAGGIRAPIPQTQNNNESPSQTPYVRPQAEPLGESVTVQPQSQSDGGSRVPSMPPPVSVPQAEIKGDVKIPRHIKEPVARPIVPARGLPAPTQSATPKENF